MTFQAEAIAQDTGEILMVTPRGLDLPGRVTRVSLELPQDLTHDEWSALGTTLKSVEGSVMWWIGDWLRFGEQKWGTKYKDAEIQTGYDEQTLRIAKHVASRFGDLFRRRNKLTFAHHQEVASLDHDLADRLLSEAEERGLKRNEFRCLVSKTKAARAIATADVSDETCTVADLWLLVQQGVKFGTIYADPPWLYDNQGTRAATKNHYDGMTVEELCELPIQQLAAENSHLHLWTTNGFLFECPKIFEAWGFEFKSSFIWVKSQIGLGNYWRNSHEFLFTAVRGDAERFNDRSLQSWLECARGQHSEKPEQVRSFIERASPRPRLELFGRKAVHGWRVWGNQIERSLFTQDIKEIAA